MTRDYRCPDNHKHAETGTCYNEHGCGCEECVTARREYQFWRENLRRAGRWDRAWSVDGTGTRRRMQALAFMGWPTPLLGDLLHTTQAQAHALLRKERVAPDTARRVADLYDRIWDQVPPGGRRVYTMNLARREGWVPPLAWDDDTIDDVDAEPDMGDNTGFRTRLDETVIQDAVSGLQPRLSPLETREVVTRLWHLRWSDGRIAQHINISDRTVERARHQLDLAAFDQNELLDAA